MSKPSSVEKHLDRLAALRLAPSAPEVTSELRKALGAKANLIIAKAATLVAEFQRNDFAPDLVAAFERLMVDAGAMDKGCAALTAIAKALVDTDERADSDGARRVFLAGIRHVQMEPVWGGSADAAGELRGLCAMGLVKTGYKDAMVELADLLADPDAQPRAGAARALGFTGQEAAALLLRFKLASQRGAGGPLGSLARLGVPGEREPDVTGECLAAILRLGPCWAVAYVSGYLDDPDPSLCASAALALGESRQPAALEPLLALLKREPDAEVRTPLFLAIAMLRTPESREALIGTIATGKPADAVEAIGALAIYKHDAAVVGQVERAAMARNEATIVRAYRAAFPS